MRKIEGARVEAGLKVGCLEGARVGLIVGLLEIEVEVPQESQSQ